MSGIAKNFDKAIRKELTANAAWLPITNTFKIGDYGFFEGGVFRSIGNIKNIFPDIELVTEQGPKTKIDFISDGTKTYKFNAEGKMIESFAALGNAEASLQFIFEEANSCVIKAEISSMQLQNIEDVAVALAKKDRWRKKYKVVSTVYNAKNCLLMCSKEAGTEFSITADASILKEIEIGKVNGGFEMNSSRDSVFEVIGESGVLALRLFKLNWLNRINILKAVNKETLIIEDGLFEGIEDDF